MANEDVIRTKDFYLTAYLLSRGLRLYKLDRMEPRRVFFVFHNVEGGEKLVEDFFLGKAEVEPKKFSAAIREAKQLLYSNDD